MPLSFSASVFSLSLLHSHVPASFTAHAQVRSTVAAATVLEPLIGTDVPGANQIITPISDLSTSSPLLARLLPEARDIVAPSVSVEGIGVTVVAQVASTRHLTPPSPLVIDRGEFAPKPVVTAVPRHQVEGVASWYQTYAGTCASLDAPRGTTLTITDLYSGASTRCLVDDSGPYVTGRVVDLAPDVFGRLGSIQGGLILVRVTW